jgi:hypothetical protein
VAPPTGPPGPAPPVVPPAPLPPPSRPGPPPRPTPTLPVPPATPVGPPRQYSVLPRTGSRFNITKERGSNGEDVFIVTGGAIINVRNAPGIGFVDLEADRLVIWTKGADPQRLLNNLQTPQGETSNDLEFYLAGHVIIREQEKPTTKEQKVLLADEVYYDVNRNVAIALNARLELTSSVAAVAAALGSEPLILSAAEVLRTSATTYQVGRSEIFSSKLRDDPGLKVVVAQATVEEKQVPRTNLFGRPILDAKGQPILDTQDIIRARNVFFEIEDVPFFYLPYVVTDARDPLGPLQDFNFGYSRVFGTQVGVTLDVYKLLGVLPVGNTRWRLNLDYLSARGPGIGSTFDYIGKFDPAALPNPLNPPATYNGSVKLYGIYDRGFDNLGGARPNLDTFQPDGFRGRAFWRQGFYDLPYGFNVQSQVSLLHDRNFLEQYYKREFDTEPNQATFLYAVQRQDNWAWSGLVEPRVRNWVTETERLPRFDGYLIGQSLFDRLTYNAHASGEYARLRLTSDPPGGLQGLVPPPVDFPPYVSPTDVADSTGRFSLMQDLSLPLALGPLKLVPYGQLELAEYTRDLTGNERGRVWGGGGVRGSIPLTRLYPEVQSELLNLNGINHKIVASGNYFYAETNEPHTRFPQLDRLNDDTTDQTLRDFRPSQPTVNPAHGYYLATGNTSFSPLFTPMFEPQVYAIRRLVDNRIDTLDNIEVFQADISQRLQTKRGYPGAQHIIDWMTLDTSISYFPNSTRDNFGHPFAFLEYRYLWNIGDRTALESTGWFNPYTNGPYVFTVGAFFNRPDRTNFYLGYRVIEPVQSRALTAAVTYIFSPKYAMTFTTTYDFGTAQALNNSLLFTRVGTDLQVSVGFSYNALQNNFGALFEIVPNLVPPSRRLGAVAASGPGGLTGR